VYPIAFEADPEQRGRNRLAALLRAIVVIPWAIVAVFWLLAAGILAIAAWFAILLTGRYPQGMFEFNVRAVRLLARVGGFAYLLTDRFPSFDGDPDDAYPIRLAAAPPKESYDRLKTGLRPIIGIPVVLLGYIHAVIAAVCSALGWFAIVVAGELPPSLFRPIRDAVAFQTRAAAYFLLLTEDYPPFDLEPAAERGGA
jgi:Domain of unknown function (DUF4389)